MNTTAHLVLRQATLARNEAPEWKWLLFSGATVGAFASLVAGGVIAAIALAVVPVAIIALDTRAAK